MRRLLEDTPKKYQGRKLSCLPSEFDPRNYQYAKLTASAGFKAAKPSPIDYRPNLPGAFEQEKRGSCIAGAEAWTVKAFQNMRQGDYPAQGFSVAFLYSMCKAIDGIKEEGTTPKAAMQVLQKYGVCPENIMPYSTLTSLPEPKVPAVPEAAKTAAARYKIRTYAQICSTSDKDRSNLLSTIRQALQQEGPFLMAILVCDNFVPDKNNKLPLPQGNVLGGHGIGIAGDFPSIECLLVRNTWGSDWGDNGYALMPYSWLTSKRDFGWYVFESWTATSLFVPKPASRIEIVPGFNFIVIDGQNVLLDQPAVIDPKTNRTVVPVRAMAGNMGYLTQMVGNKIILTKPN